MKAQLERLMLGPGSRWQRNHEPKASDDSWKNSRTSTRKNKPVMDSPTEENQQQQKNPRTQIRHRKQTNQKREKQTAHTNCKLMFPFISSKITIEPWRSPPSLPHLIGIKTRSWLTSTLGNVENKIGKWQGATSTLVSYIYRPKQKAK
jgi:hypothetical protein